MNNFDISFKITMLSQSSDLSNDQFIFDIIKKMIAKGPKQRISMKDVKDQLQQKLAEGILDLIRISR